MLRGFVTKRVDGMAIIASTPGAALESRPGGPAFAKKYKERYGQDPGLYAPYFYDGTMLIAAKEPVRILHRYGKAVPSLTTYQPMSPRALSRRT